jgi:omega-6 fatty acid desaturase (delta-12 desaturase)
VKSNIDAEAAIEASARSWTLVLAQYRQPSPARSIGEIAATALPFVALWVLTALAVLNGYWLGLLLTIPAAGFLVRLFILQHDCGHGTLFARRGINDWIGRVIGVFTLTPYDYWRRTHAVHHASAAPCPGRAARATGSTATRW